jgi:uncharacterized protein involved in type VI secretion and phage assembly
MSCEQPQNGIVVGVVTSLEDPDGIGRVRVGFPHLDGQQSWWARLATLMAGASRGTRFLPEVGDEVLVAFEQGDARRPYVLGGLWNTAAAPPPDDGKQKENNWRYIKSRSGHLLRFDDTDGAERIEIIDKGGKHRLIIDTAGDQIEIICDKGNISVTAAKGDVKVKASQVTIESTGDMTLKASGTMTIKGAKVDIN